MTDQQKPLSAALNAVTNGTDHATKIKVCRAIAREAAKKIMSIGAGALVESIEEVEFVDQLDRTILDYLKAKQRREYGATYVGVTGPMDMSIESAAETIAAAPAQQDQAAA